MDFEGETPDGVTVRIHIDGDDCLLFTLPPGDHSVWSRPLELHRTDGGGPP